MIHRQGDIMTNNQPQGARPRFLLAVTRRVSEGGAETRAGPR
ncbi:MAG: hypothetical protein VB878_23695 [Pirellulaceae bacterium]|jgi:hypothetical protein